MSQLGVGTVPTVSDAGAIVSDSRLPCWTMACPSRAFARATDAGAYSSPVTTYPRARASMSRLPSPLPTSSRVRPLRVTGVQPR